MASRQTSILALVVLLGALAVPTAGASSLRGSRTLEEASGPEGEKKVGAVLVNASEEKVSVRCAVVLCPLSHSDVRSDH